MWWRQGVRASQCKTWNCHASDPGRICREVYPSVSAADLDQWLASFQPVWTMTIQWWIQSPLNVRHLRESVTLNHCISIAEPETWRNWGTVFQMYSQIHLISIKWFVWWISLYYGGSQSLQGDSFFLAFWGYMTLSWKLDRKEAVSKQSTGFPII